MSQKIYLAKTSSQQLCVELEVWEVGRAPQFFVEQRHPLQMLIDGRFVR